MQLLHSSPAQERQCQQPLSQKFQWAAEISLCPVAVTFSVPSPLLLLGSALCGLSIILSLTLLSLWDLSPPWSCLSLEVKPLPCPQEGAWSQCHLFHATNSPFPEPTQPPGTLLYSDFFLGLQKEVFRLLNEVVALGPPLPHLALLQGPDIPRGADISKKSVVACFLSFLREAFFSDFSQRSLASLLLSFVFFIVLYPSPKLFCFFTFGLSTAPGTGRCKLRLGA